MKAGLKLDNMSFNRVQLALRNIARLVPDNARKTMRRSAERIIKNAKLYVPEDTTALRESIRLEATYGFRGRLQINVVVGGQEVVTIRGRVVNLDQYAAIIHEQYQNMKPGKRTQQKRLENPGAYIGEGFLQRAADEEEKRISRDMISAVQSIIKTEGMS